MGIADLPLNQHEKYKILWLTIWIGVKKGCNKLIVITEDLCFIFLTDIANSLQRDEIFETIDVTRKQLKSKIIYQQIYIQFMFNLYSHLNH